MTSALEAACERGEAGRDPARQSRGSGSRLRRVGSRGLRWLGASVRSPDLVLVVFLLSVALVLAPAAGGASPEPIDGCTTIGNSTEHQLTSDIDAAQDYSGQQNCIEINASDASIDGRGHTIALDDTQYAFSPTDGSKRNITVHNVTVVGGERAFDFENANESTIHNVTIEGTSIGIKFYQGNHTLRDVELRNTQFEGPESDVVGERVQIGTVGVNGSIVSFDGRIPLLDELTDPNSSSDDVEPLDRYLFVDTISGRLGVHYEQSDVDGIPQSALGLRTYDSTNESWDPLESTVDTENQTVSTSELANHSDVGLFGEATPHFDVTLGDRSTSLLENETVTVEATVENTGLANGTGPVSLTTDGVVRTNRRLTLNRSESENVTLSWTPGDGDAGLYDAAVESEHDSESWHLNVSDPDAPVWETDADWNAGTHDRTVSDGVGDRENDTVRLGYTRDVPGSTAYWPFDEDGGSIARDVTGTYDGNVTGNVSVEQPGLLNSTGYTFPGDGRVAVDDEVPTIDDQMAVSTWIRTTQLGTNANDGDNQTALLNQGDWEQKRGWNLFDDGDVGSVVVFRVMGDDGYSDVTVNRSRVNDSTWHNLVGVRDGENVTLYLDGEQVDTAENTSLEAHEGEIGIGSWSGDGANYDGDMDEVRLYDRSLSESEVQALYDTTRNGTHTTGWRPLEEALDVASLELNASATVPTGDATAYVESDTDGDGAAEQTSDPIPLSSGTDTYDVENLSTDADTVRLRTEFETTDVQQTPVVDRAALEETATFQVSDVVQNGSTVAGDALAVNATVENVGDQSGIQNLTLEIDGSGTTADETTVELTSGERETVSLEWQTTSGDAGEYDATVASANDSDTRQISVEEPSGGGLPAPPGPEPTANFQVAIDDTNSPVGVGETIAVTTTVSNVGDASGTESVALRRAGETIQARNVTLAANASETVVFEWTPGAGRVGSNRLAVESGASSDVRYVTVESAPVVDPPPVELTVEETTGPLDAGRPFAVTATVEASEDVETTVELRDFGGDGVASEPLDLEAGESTTVTLTWQTAVEDAGSGPVTVTSEGASASADVRLREPAAFTGTIESVTSPVEVDDALTVQALVESEASGERTSDVVLEIDGAERDVRTVTLAPGDAERVTLEWTPSEPDVGERELTLSAGADATSRTVTVQRAEAGFFGGYAPEWAGTAVDYAPTQQDTHVGGFLWLTALMGAVGGYLFATRSALDARLLGVTLLVAAVRTSTDVLHATVESLTLEPLLALNASLELTAGLLFLAFAAASAEYDRLLDRRCVALLGAIGLGGAALAASNPAHGLVFSNVSLVEGPFTYVSADQGPLGWVLLTVTLGSLLCSVALLGRSFLAGRDPAWRPVGVLASGLCLATVVVAMSVLQRGPLPQYDYTGAGVAGFLLVATTAVGHGLHRIKRDAQRSLIEDLDDPIVITNDAREVVEYNAAAARLLPTIEVDVSFRSLVGYEPEWPAPGETTTSERNLAAILPSRTDGGATDPAFDPDDSPGDDPHSDGDPLDDGPSGGDPAGGDPAGDAPLGDDPTGESEPAAVGDGEAGATTEEPIAAPAATVDAEAGSSGSESPEPGDGTVDALVDRPDDATTELPPTDVHYLVQTTSVTVDTGDTIGYTVRFTDVSELTQRTEELARKNAQLEQVASTISHDLRNPLTVADGYLEIASEAVPEPDRPGGTADEESVEVAASSIAEHLEPIRSSLQRMEAIIEDVLALARSSEPVTIEEGLRFAAVVEDAWRTVDTGRATLFVESDGAIDADPRRLQRILENLFRNAVDHVGEDVAVVVGLSEDGFYVADDGPGIPEDQQDDVFEQGHTSSQEGTGLGLSIVTQLARAHGWSVSVDPEYDGARFVFEGCDVDLEDAGSDA